MQACRDALGLQARLDLRSGVTFTGLSGWGSSHPRVLGGASRNDSGTQFRGVTVAPLGRDSETLSERGPERVSQGGTHDHDVYIIREGVPPPRFVYIEREAVSPLYESAGCCSLSM